MTWVPSAFHHFAMSKFVIVPICFKIQTYNNGHHSIMATTSSSLDQFTQSTFPFYDNSFIDIYNAFARALSNTTQFNMILSNAFADAYPIYFNAISE
ncbi:MAG: hypothetical protein GEU26_08770 [Nitrososphaeraceae archaeon]|nr:hypothetical protein [Nitrososphaeraceae archaeon]